MPERCRIDDFAIGLIKEKIRADPVKVFKWLTSKVSEDVSFEMMDNRSPALVTGGIVHYLTPDEIEELMNL